MAQVDHSPFTKCEFTEVVLASAKRGELAKLCSSSGFFFYMFCKCKNKMIASWFNSYLTFTGFLYHDLHSISVIRNNLPTTKYMYSTFTRNYRFASVSCYVTSEIRLGTTKQAYFTYLFHSYRQNSLCYFFGSFQLSLPAPREAFHDFALYLWRTLPTFISIRLNSAAKKLGPDVGHCWPATPQDVAAWLESSGMTTLGDTAPQR